MGVVLINGGFAFYQEYRAEKAFDELKSCSPHGNYNQRRKGKRDNSK